MIYQFFQSDIATPSYSYVEVIAFLPGDNILCDCYQESEYSESGELVQPGQLVAHRAVFNISESNVIDFHSGEKKFIKGEAPTMEWLEITIRAYAAYKKIEVLESDTKSQMLEKINSFELNPIT